MKVVYVAHPLGIGEGRKANLERAARWVAWVGEQGNAPIADWITLAGQWDESRRKEGLRIDCALVARCDELWLVGGRASPGMLCEADAAVRAGVLVIDLTRFGAEPPTATEDSTIYDEIALRRHESGR